MWIIANGKRQELAQAASVADFMRERNLDPALVIAELNGEPIARESYERVRLSEGDRLELVHAVAGGAEPSTMGKLGEWRRQRLAGSRLYVVTGGRRAQGDLDDFLDAILDAGTDIVQLREKDAEAGDLLRWGEVFKDAVDKHQALFVVNDRPDVALALDADGVHVGQNDLPAAAARSVMGPDALIGLSTHDDGQFDSAPAEADYLCAGPVFETPTKPGRRATGVELIAHAAGRSRTGAELRPWFAIGGLDPGNLPPVVLEGATRIVVVRAVTEAADPAEAVAALTELLPPA